MLEDQLSFYASYINSRKQFERKIPRSHGVTDEEFLGLMAGAPSTCCREEAAAHKVVVRGTAQQQPKRKTSTWIELLLMGGAACGQQRITGMAVPVFRSECKTC